MSKPVINVNNLGKTYWLYPTLGKRLLGCFVNPRWVGGYAFNALSALSFDLYPGEAIALIGKNGAGKSTALQVLAGITPATEGNFEINGRVCALLELGSGFNPEFTGRQNIALAGILLGLTREQIKQEEQNIIEFADIGEFIDQPVKFYSSGMFVRLAFAVAVAGTPDLLIVDEALAVGDIFFRQKCYARLREMREKGMAVILVTHSSADAQEFCDKAVLLEHGRQTYMGDPTEAMVRYYFTQQGISAEQLKTAAAKRRDVEEAASGTPWPHLEQYFMPVARECQTGISGAVLESFCVTDENDHPCVTFEQGKPMRVYTKFRVEFPVEIPSTTATIMNTAGVAVYSKGTNLMQLEAQPSIVEPSVLYSCHEIVLDIACGDYSLSSSLVSIDPLVFSRREYIDHGTWVEGSQRLVGVLSLAAISVILPFTSFPSRTVGFGLANLPAKAFLSVDNREGI